MKQLVIFFMLLLYSPLFADIVDIKAEHFYANNINHKAFFEGGAIIKQGSNEINASKVTVFFNDQRKALKYEAQGAVKFDLTEKGIHYSGVSNKIIYAPSSSKYYFIGDVTLIDLTNNRTIKADKVSLDLKTGLADIKGSSKKPVHFRFEIEDRK